MKQVQPMLIGKHTYGWYYSTSKSFVCSHGGWEAGLDILDENTCKLKLKGYPVVEYTLLESIPEDYYRVGE